MNAAGIGRSVRRKEDPRLLTGRGRFIDDVNLPGQAYAYVLRSPHANARIVELDIRAAAASDGVLAVFTAADLAADGIGDLPPFYLPAPPEGDLVFASGLPILARGRVRHIGEPVAFVVAETGRAARAAAERIEMAVETLPAVTNTAEADRPGAPQVWADAPDNLMYAYAKGSRSAVDAAFAGAAHITVVELVNSRLMATSIEPRGALGSWDRESGRFTLHSTGQMPHRTRRYVAEAFGEAQESLRVIVGDAAGAFGPRNMVYPEVVLVVWAARRLGRSVKWSGGGEERFLGDTQARDNVSRAELALDGDGRFLALRVRTTAAMGAYLSNMGALAPINGPFSLAGPYRTPAMHVEVRAVYTNTVRLDVFRGAGRPEAIYLMERLVDAATREIGLDRAEIRRRNMIPPAELPYATPFGMTYDSGDYEGAMTRALGEAGWNGFAERRAESARRGRLRGIGMAAYVERNSGGGPDAPTTIRIEADGTVTVLSGMMSNGQGHETAFAQLVADRFDLDLSEARIVQGDTGLVSEGIGTLGSHSLVLDSWAMTVAMDRIVEKAKPVAGSLLEAAVADLEFAGGGYRITGTDRRVTMRQVLRAVGAEGGLEARASIRAEQHTFPNGCHVCELEIDPETGATRLLAYHMVQDVGVVVNPMIVAGQLHGGTGQGIGQVLFEHTVYDRDGQLLSGSFMDYCIPRAGDLPALRVTLDGTPCPSNPLGVKGCGESGAIAAPPAVVNAVLDALAPLGVRHIDMPATPERVWRAIRAARRYTDRP